MKQGLERVVVTQEDFDEHALQMKVLNQWWDNWCKSHPVKVEFYPDDKENSDASR